MPSTRIVEDRNTTRSSPARPPFWICAAPVAGAFVWVNVKTAMSVAPWTDDVMQVDAAINLHLGKGWVSTAWFSESQFNFWAANNPLFTYLLYLWSSVAGIAPQAVRALNYILLFACVALITNACGKKGLIRSTWAGALLAILIICNQPVCYVYRTGRADLATMLVLALLFWIDCAIEDAGLRDKLLFLGSLLVIPCGIQSIPCIILLFAIEAMFTKRFAWREFLSVALGTAAGGVLLSCLYLWKGVLKTFIAQTFASNYNILGLALQAAIIHDHKSFVKFAAAVRDMLPNRVLAVILSDYSLIPLLLFLLLVVILLLRKSGETSCKRIAIAGLAFSLLIAYGMILSGRYPIYYSWMGSIPAMIAAVRCLEEGAAGKMRPILVAGVIAIGSAILLGAPLQITRQVRAAAPGSYSVVQSQLRQLARPGEAIYADPVFYYAAKLDGIPFMSTTYGGGRGYPHLLPGEASSVSMLIVRDGDIDQSQEVVGGKWVRTGQIRSPYGFLLTVFRRTQQ